MLSNCRITYKAVIGSQYRTSPKIAVGAITELLYEADHVIVRLDTIKYEYWKVLLPDIEFPWALYCVGNVQTR